MPGRSAGVQLRRLGTGPPIAADPVAGPGGPVPRPAASGVGCVLPSPKRRPDGSVSRPWGESRFARGPTHCRRARLANTRAAFWAGSPLQPQPWQVNRAWFLRDSGFCIPQVPHTSRVRAQMTATGMPCRSAWCRRIVIVREGAASANARLRRLCSATPRPGAEAVPLRDWRVGRSPWTASSRTGRSPV